VLTKDERREIRRTLRSLKGKYRTKRERSEAYGNMISRRGQVSSLVSQILKKADDNRGTQQIRTEDRVG
jgi:hypothetical protein